MKKKEKNNIYKYDFYLPNDFDFSQYKNFCLDLVDTDLEYIKKFFDIVRDKTLDN